MFTFLIKNCTVNEIVSLLTLFDPYSDRPYSFRDDEDNRKWPEKLAANANSIICYNDKEDVIGCLFFYDNEIALRNQEGYCVFFCVLPDYRRSGIASEMIFRVKKHLNSKGIPFFKLKCAKSNNAAFSLYKKTGFDVVDDDGRAFTMVSKTKELLS
ncbi:MAG: GNAT family N-acetyltransferase [Muribaculaceae bacterium]|nr:GNAT family N-acetyltransferase [Muribaculaceae bacterium]